MRETSDTCGSAELSHGSALSRVSTKEASNARGSAPRGVSTRETSDAHESAARGMHEFELSRLQRTDVPTKKKNFIAYYFMS